MVRFRSYQILKKTSLLMGVRLCASTFPRPYHVEASCTWPPFMCVTCKSRIEWVTYFFIARQILSYATMYFLGGGVCVLLCLDYKFLGI